MILQDKNSGAASKTFVAHRVNNWVACSLGQVGVRQGDSGRCTGGASLDGGAVVEEIVPSKNCITARLWRENGADGELWTNWCEHPVTVHYCLRGVSASHSHSCPADGEPFTRSIAVPTRTTREHPRVRWFVPHRNMNWVVCGDDQIAIKQDLHSYCMRK